MKNWVIIKERLALKGKIFKYLLQSAKSPNTNIEGEFDVLEFKDWVNVIAETKDGKIVLVRQRRQGSRSVTIEIPGGAVDPGEDYLCAAKRELREESGYTSNNWTLLGNINPNPAFMTNRVVTYLAKEAKRTSQQELDPLEEVEVFEEHKDNISKMLKNCEIDHALIIAAFYFYFNKNHEIY